MVGRAAERDDYPRLRDWLIEVMASGVRCRLLWEHVDGRHLTELWSINGSLVYLMMQPDQLGWDIFTATPTTKAGEALEDAEKRLGIR